MSYQPGDQITKEQAFELALDQAKLGLGHVEPNPCVGCVVINEESNKLISVGYHKKFGGAHAEVEALKNLENGEGLTIIVTLEPCSHYGKTPPCADLVISKKFKKLIYMSQDPNPKVSGRGVERIKAAGIAVEKAPDEFSKLNSELSSRFFYAFENKETFFHLKWAQSLDGKTNPKGDEQWITGVESREYGQFLRAQSDAVLIGRETLEQDDPSLNIRIEGFEKENKVIVFDPKLKSLGKIKDKNVFKLRPLKSVIYLCDEPVESVDVDFVKLHKNKEGDYCLKTLAKDLYAQLSLQSVFVEGGARTLSAFLKQGVYGRVSVFTAPFELGDEGESLVEGFLVEEARTSEKFSVVSDKNFGSDSFVDFLV